MIIYNTNLISPIQPAESVELGKVFGVTEILTNLSVLIFEDFRKYWEQVKLTDDSQFDEFFKHHTNVSYSVYADSSFSKGILECRTILHICVIQENRYHHNYQICVKHRKWDCRNQTAFYPNNLGEYIALCDGVIFVKNLKQMCRFHIFNFWYNKKGAILQETIITAKDKNTEEFKECQNEYFRIKGISDLAAKLHKHSTVIHSDSKTALSWVKHNKVSSTFFSNKVSNPKIDSVVKKAKIISEDYLLKSSSGKADFSALNIADLAKKYKHINPFPYESKIAFANWNTKEKGEIPADFNRKRYYKSNK